MLKIRCYWAYYSAWFKKEIPDSRMCLIESILHRLEVGRRTLDVNRCNASIYQAAIGEKGAATIDYVTGSGKE